MARLGDWHRTAETARVSPDGVQRLGTFSGHEHGVAPVVMGPLPAGDVAPPLPPGIVLVAAREPGRTARRLARELGAERWCTPAQALEELDRRRQASLVHHRRRAAECRAAAAEARAEVAAERAALATGLAGAAAAQVRVAAAEVRRSRRTVEAARSGLGPRPRLHDDALATGAARAAHEAHAALEQARHQCGADLPQANSILSVANACAGTVVVGRLVSEAFDPAFFLVALLPLAALGYTVAVVGRHVRRCRALARRRWTALRSLDVCTMAALASLEQEAGDWTARSTKVAKAEKRLHEAETAWRSLVGTDADVSTAERIAVSLERLAELETSGREAADRWTDALVALQCAEDTFGRGHPPLVVLDRKARPDSLPSRSQLATAAGGGTVVLVGPALAMAARQPEPAPPEPAEPAAVPPAPTPAPAGAPAPVPACVPAPAAASAVVDLRERVLAGLQRLRARQGRPEERPPGSVAAGG